MKTLLPFLRTKLFLLGFLFASTIIVATTATINFKNNSEKTNTVKKETVAVKGKNTANKIVSDQRIAQSQTQEATLTSDSSDYQPGSTCTLTGTGFAPGETVTLQVLHYDYQPGDLIGADHEPWYVVADADGNFVTTWHVCEDDCVGELLKASADGQSSGLHVETYFTDATSVSPATGGLNISADKALNSASPVGGAFTTLGDIVVSEQSGNGTKGDFAGSGTLILTAPTGWQFNSGTGTISFQSGRDITAASISVATTTITVTLTIPTTSNTDNFTISGIQVKANDGSVLPNSGNILRTSGNPGTASLNGVTNDVTNFGSLSQTAGALVNFLVQSPGGTNIPDQTDNVAFDIKITAADQFGNPVTSFNGGNNKVNITSNATLTNGGGTTAAFSNGVLTPLSVTISPAFNNATITATRNAGGTQSGTSNSFNVLAVDRIGAVTVGAQSGVAECGTASSVTFAVTANRVSNGTVNGTYSALFLPAGVTYSTSPTTFTSTGNNAIPGTTVTVNTPTSLTTGNYPFTIRLTTDAGEIDDGAATLIVTDNTPPVFTGTYTTSNLGCNPTDISGALGSATATDGCATPSVEAIDGGISSNGCSRTQTRTFTATDGSGNTATTSRTVTWTADTDPPVFTGSYTTVDLGCNPTDIDGPLGAANATDGCGIPTVNSGVDGSVSSDGCGRSQSRTFTATDGCGNTQTVSRTVTWTEDITPPVFTGSYATTNLGCNPTNIDATLGAASATDGCGTPTVNDGVDGTDESDGCLRTRTRTFIATDACGNTATQTRSVTWTADVTPPVFTGSYASQDLGCNPNNIDATLGSATATDGCGTPTVNSGTDGADQSDGCLRTRTRTFTATDACGNTNTISRSVTWTADATPPVFTGSYATTDLGCNPNNIDATLGSATATDGCGIPTVNSGTDGTDQSDGCLRTRTRTFTATDACGNTATISRSVTWTADVTPPVFTGSYATQDLGCNPNNIDATLGSATATDGCGTPTVNAGVDGADQSDGCLRTRTRTFTATDACGNTATISRSVTWTADITPPVFTGSYATQDLGCNPNNISTTLGSATATDGCGIPTVSGGTDATDQSDGCLRTRTRTFTATDACGNTATQTRSVTWTADVTPPVFTGSYATTNLGCNPTNIDATLGSGTATDGCGTPTVSSGTDGADQSDGCLRTRTRTFTATDACGNTATKCRSVIWTADVTPPVFTGSYATVELGCNPTNISTTLNGATATDGCGTPTVNSGTDGADQSDGCLRTRTRTFTATDACGNTSTISRSVTWTADVTPPVFTGSYATANLGCNPTNILATLGSATATDGCGTPTVSSGTDGADQSDGCLRTRTRTFTATDACGNTATKCRSVTWTADVTPPVFTGSYATTNLGCNPTNIDATLGSGTATDGCGTPTVNSGTDGADQSDGCLRTRTRTFTATDACGNTATQSRSVTWTADVTPPVFTGSYATANLGCNPTDISGALGSGTATDGCGTPTVSSGTDGADQSDGCLRTRTRTFTATDACGNTATKCRSVTWTADLTPPVFTGSYATTNLGCNPTNIDGTLGSGTATDGCGTPTVSGGTDGADQSDGCLRTRTRTFTATDACGNTATQSRSVTWTADITPPVFTGSYATTNLGCNPTNIDATLGSGTATDGCGTPTVNSGVDATDQSNGCLRTRTRTFTATDACGNTATKCRSVTWTADVTPPVFTGSYATTDIGCNPTNIDATLGSATATDGCGIPTVSSGTDGADQSSGCLRTRTRTFTATDACGNTATKCRSVTWTADVTPPTFTGNYATVTLGINPSATDITAALGSATATDGCGIPSVNAGVDGLLTSSGCGRTQIRTFTATDGCNNTQTISRTVTWTYDQTPPSINLTVSPTCLWPPNHKMRDITIGGNVTDNCSSSPLTNWSITSVISNEPVNGTGDGNTGPDFLIGSGGQTLQLRAEREGTGTGRVYTITFTATDAAGNTSTATATVIVAHNITAPTCGSSFKVGSTVSLGGTFWDIAGNKHTAKWLIDGNAVATGTVTEPTGMKSGTVTGSYKFTAPGIYKQQMNVTDQKGITSYANTNGDMQALVVIYDPNGGYTFGSGSFTSPAGSVPSNPAATPKITFGFQSNYYKGATNPKGETEFDFDAGDFQFNALNYDVLVVDGAKAQFKGFGKISNDAGTIQSGVAFTMTAIDGKLAGTGVTDKIHMKIYNKNTGEVYYDNQPGNSDADAPTIPIDANGDITIVNPNMSVGATTSTGIGPGAMRSTAEAEQQPGVITPLAVKAFPNPSEKFFNLVVEGGNAKDDVQIMVYNTSGVLVHQAKGTANRNYKFGEGWISGMYFVQVRQGKELKTLQLMKQ